MKKILKYIGIGLLFFPIGPFVISFIIGAGWGLIVGFPSYYKNSFIANSIEFGAVTMCIILLILLALVILGGIGWAIAQNFEKDNG